MTREVDWLLHEKYNGEKSEGFFADCKRLTSGEPLAYLIGHIPFLDTTVYLDSKPLIPRPETEFWVDKAIVEIQQATAQDEIPYLRVLDLCAGSGAIGVAVAKAVKDAQVTFSEIDSAHLPTILKNIEANVQTDTSIYDSVKIKRCTVTRSDLFENIQATFDFILTNPPYVDAKADTIDQSVFVHEPHRALFGGTDGMEIIKKIITGAKVFLAHEGQLWIEHEPFQQNAITQYAEMYGYTSTTHEDQYGVIRYSILVVQ